MIVVIADDFTGAAELAGIGLRYNLKVELATSVADEPAADLFVVCTDSRSLNKANAEKITADTIKKVLQLRPEFIYKKIDSVFRGHVLDELKIQIRESGLKKALVIGANPSLGRAISEGNYFIKGELISETDFGTDPEFAITDSSVLHMIKAGNGEASVLRHTDKLPDEGIVVGEAVSEADVAVWANRVDETWLAAGAGDFFTALLQRKYKSNPKSLSAARLPHLYISGTAFNRSRWYVKKIKQELNCVAYMTPAMMQTGNIEDKGWYDRVAGILSKHGKAVIAIDDDEVDPWNVTAVYLRTTMAEVVQKVLEKCEVKEMFIEGGSTAAAILKQLGIEKLSVMEELQRGVVRMKANDLYITVKPGSYELPEQIKRLYIPN